MYYNQATGQIHWPPDDGLKVGSKHSEVIEKDIIFIRYVDNSGNFLGNVSDSFESRALAPHSENTQIYYYKSLEDYEMTTGEVASWFGRYY